MRLEDMNWMQVEDLLRRDDRLMIVLGACEQHGYLSLLTDVRIPLALAEAASRETGVPLAPPVPFGISPSFAAYPGTLTLRASTFMALVADLARGAYDQGFRRIVFVNGHGGNEPGRVVLSEMVNELPGLKACWYSWWTSRSVTDVAEEAGLASFHAGWIEAFEFCRVTDLPEREKPAQAPTRVLDARETRERYGDGVFGGPYRVGDDIMRRVFDAAVADIVERLRFE